MKKEVIDCQMVDYNIVKHCRMCRKRYVVNKSEAKKNYCDACQLRINKERNNPEGGEK